MSKRTEVYKYNPQKDTSEEKKLHICREVDAFLRKRYLEIYSAPYQYLSIENNSSLLICRGEDVCKDMCVAIQIMPQEAEVPKELSDLLKSKDFVRIQKN